MNNPTDKNSNPGPPTNTKSQTPRTTISIPSFREVQNAERSSSQQPIPRHHKSSLENNDTATAKPSAPPPYNPFAFIDIQQDAIPKQMQSTSHQALHHPIPHQHQHPTNHPIPPILLQQQQQRKTQHYPYTHDPNPPRPQPPAHTSSTQQQNFNIISVNQRQKGNPLLKHVHNVRWQFVENIIPDYILGQTIAALFLSLRFHLLKPEYIYSRMKELGKAYRMRVLLVLVDTEDATEPLAQVTRAAMGNDFTLLCGFSVQECARYLETLKSYERKPAETIQKDLGTDFVSRANAVLTTVRGVNKTDVKTLGDSLGSIAKIFTASPEDFTSCPGIGTVKAKRLYDAFHEPFRKTVHAAGGGGLAIGSRDNDNEGVSRADTGQQSQEKTTSIVDNDGDGVIIDTDGGAQGEKQHGMVLSQDDDCEDDEDDFL